MSQFHCIPGPNVVIAISVWSTKRTGTPKKETPAKVHLDRGTHSSRGGVGLWVRRTLSIRWQSRRGEIPRRMQSVKRVS